MQTATSTASHFDSQRACRTSRCLCALRESSRHVYSETHDKYESLQWAMAVTVSTHIRLKGNDFTHGNFYALREYFSFRFRMANHVIVKYKETALPSASDLLSRTCASVIQPTFFIHSKIQIDSGAERTKHIDFYVTSIDSYNLPMCSV